MAEDHSRPPIARAIRRPFAEVDCERDASPTGPFDLLAREQVRKVRDNPPHGIGGGGCFPLPESCGVSDDVLSVPADASGCSAGFALAPQAAIARIPAALEGVVPFRAELAAFGHSWLTQQPAQPGEFFSLSALGGLLTPFREEWTSLS
jgi:hypothetical protein